jgi:hypothetical protein
MTTFLEEALANHDKALDPVIKQSGQLSASLKAWKKATLEGNLGERQKQADRAIQIARALQDPLNAARESWEFDSATYLGSGAWRAELMDTANHAGYRVFEEGESIVASPVIVVSEPARSALRIGRARWPKLRPSVVVAELKRLRERSEKGLGVQDLLDRLYEAVSRLDQNPRPNGEVKAKLRDVYDLFSIAPGWKKDNPEASFAQDLYALHRSEVRTTRSGKKYEYEFPSGQPKGREIFEVVDESGRPIRYYMVHFR